MILKERRNIYLNPNEFPRLTNRGETSNPFLRENHCRTFNYALIIGSTISRNSIEPFHTSRVLSTGADKLSNEYKYTVYLGADYAQCNIYEAAVSELAEPLPRRSSA